MAIKIYYDKRLWVVKITMFGINMLGFTMFTPTCVGYVSCTAIQVRQASGLWQLAVFFRARGVAQAPLFPPGNAFGFIEIQPVGQTGWPFSVVPAFFFQAYIAVCS